MITYILIMVMSGGTSQSGVATITQEFNTRESCEAARIFTADSIVKQDISVSIRSQGCFKK